MTIRRRLDDLELNNLHQEIQKTSAPTSPVQAITRAQSPTPVAAPATEPKKVPPQSNVLRIAPNHTAAQSEDLNDDDQETSSIRSNDQREELPDLSATAPTIPKKKTRGKIGVAKKPTKKVQLSQPGQTELSVSVEQPPVTLSSASAPADNYRPWEVHRLSKQDWEILQVYEAPINTDEDSIKAGLLSPHHLREYDLIMSHGNQDLWQKTWTTLDGQNFRTIDLAVNEGEIKYRTPNDGVICTLAPQLWMLFPNKHSLDINNLELITFKQKEIDVSALIITYNKENKEKQLGHDRASIIYQARRRYQSLISFLLYRESKLAEAELSKKQAAERTQQKNQQWAQRNERLLAKASPLMGLAQPLVKWVEKQSHKEEKK